MYKTNKILMLGLVILFSLAFGEWSDVYYFRVQLKGPDLIAPVADAVLDDASPDFIWYELPGAAIYRLSIFQSGVVEPVIDDSTLTDSIYMPITGLASGDYNWKTYAKDSLGNWSNPSESRAFTISPTLLGNISNNNKINHLSTLSLPPPSLVTPANGFFVFTQMPYFDWTDVTGASYYRIQIDENNNFGTPIIDECVTISEYEVPLARALPETLYYWRVRAEKQGWVMKDSIAVTPIIKDGGALVGVGDDYLYAFQGTKSNKFSKYTINSESGWTGAESIPYGYKYKNGVVDYRKLNKKFVGKGAALCYDGESKIYALRGNSTNEFWVYDMLTDAGWTILKYVPTPKGQKAGASLAYLGGKVYLLSGGYKPTDLSNFYAYDVSESTWTPMKGVDFGTTHKPWKAGSCITELDGLIYALQGGGKGNYFYVYTPTADTTGGSPWLQIESIPAPNTLFGKYKKKILVKDGGAITSGDGIIYAIKGGGTNVFWKYTPISDAGWEALDSIPVTDKKSAPKTGAAMAYADGKVWLLVGNKNPDFWCYTPEAMSKVKGQNSKVTQTVNNQPLIPNPQSHFQVSLNPFNKLTTIRYSVPVSGKVLLKLYNTSGRLIETLVNDNLNAGTYSYNLSSDKLAKGVYFVKFDSNTNNSEAKLIVR